MFIIKTDSVSDNARALRFDQILRPFFSAADYVRETFETLNEPEVRAAMNAAYHASNAGEDVDVVLPEESDPRRDVVLGVLGGSGVKFEGLALLDDPVTRYYGQFKAYQADPNAEILDVAPVTRQRSQGQIFVDNELLVVARGLTVENIVRAIEWVRTGFVVIKGENKHHTSYGMKHILEHETGIYLTNNQFKHLMAVCGHAAVNPDGLNCTYRVGERSPVLKREAARLRA